MSTGPFTRTNRNTPQRNLNKSQQPTEASLTPSQSNTSQEANTGGYVYRPPTRIVRSSVNAVKQSSKVEQKTELKKEEPQKSTSNNKIQQPLQKPLSFARKPATQIVQQTTVVKTTKIVTEVTQIREEIKPQKPKPFFGRTKPTLQPKSQAKTTTITTSKNPSEQITEENKNSQSVLSLQIKKPSSFYSYPKKISKRDSDTISEVQTEKKPQTSNFSQELKPETAKFSKTEQSSQTPQMFSSASSYKSKNTNSQVSGVQSNQSSSSLKPPPSQSVVQPVQKAYQSQKPPASTIIDSSPKPLTKSPISHTSRYKNKVVETPVKEQIPTESEHEVSKTPQKRSPLLAFAVHRLYKQNFSSHFHQVSEYCRNLKETKENGKLHQYFERNLNKFVKGYELNVLMRNSFVLLKSIFAKILKSDMVKSTDPKVIKLLENNRNQCFGKLLENILPSNFMELKASFSKIKSFSIEAKIQKNRIEAGIKIICSTQSKKMKEYWQLLCEWTDISYHIKLGIITKCSEINQAYRKSLLNQVWNRLATNKLKELTSNVKSSSQKLVSKLSPIKETKPSEVSSAQLNQSEANKQLKQKICDLQAKLSDTQQKVSQIPKQSDLRKFIQQLKDQKSQITQQISTKKERNSELKQKLQALISKVPQEPLSSLSEVKPENEESTLSLLYEIYMKIYKQSGHQCASEQNIASLCSIYRIEENSIEREIVAKWLAIQENINLKHWINLYEENYVDEANGKSFVGQRRQALKQLEEENEIVKKFIRSYVKERYMWEEVKSYVAAVINE